MNIKLRLILSRLFSPFRYLGRKTAIVFVTLWAELAFSKGMKAAEDRRAKLIRDKVEGNCMVYLAANSFRRDHLVTYTKAQFKMEKKVYGVAARLLTMNTLMRECYYHTADKWDQRGMSKHDLIVRRRAFVKERLRFAGLIPWRG